MWKRLFGNAAVDRDELQRVKAAALALLPAGVSVSVNEIYCTDPGCVGTETVILVMEPGKRTAAAKVAKFAKDVEEADIAAALDRLA